ncbi:MAG TPA: glycosyltransferase family 4 protein [Patescibacteria group bacterium]|nr:glycosyltransferase family 4 protein [Patescibacteria group bacterium]
MRLLIFSTAYLPFVGGAELAVKEVTDRLPQLEFVLVTAKMDSRLPAEEKIGNILVKRVGRGNYWDKWRLVFVGPRLARSLGEFDLVWAIMASFGGLAARVYKKQNPKVPFLLTLQEGDSLPHIYARVWWFWPFFKQIFTSANHIHSISNYLAAWAKRMGVISPITVVPNGVDLSRFSVSLSSEEKEKIRNQWGLTSTDKVVITASRLVRKNGVGDLIRAIPLTRGSVHLVVAGKGELEKELKELARKLRVEERVHFLGEISHVDLPRHLAAADIFSRPSLSEGLGNAFLEAMVIGLPVLATPVGGIPDFLHPGKTGWFCQKRNPSDIANKIEMILIEEAVSRQVASQGQELARKEYNWDLVAEKMNNIFQQLVSL